jgi:uncharacterized protein YprB with RNaseH-like and TPR domain
MAFGVSADLAMKLRALQVLGRAETRPTAAPPRLDALLGGRYQSTPHGECLVVDTDYPLAQTHGALPLEAAFQLSPRVSRLLGGSGTVEAFDPRRVLFLDTETTGLWAGTGTYVFLVGLGYVEGNAFRLRQLFMPHPAQEMSLLDHAEPILREFPVWVSFNGKTFDVPLLEGRFTALQRPRFPAPAWHLDLLHVARRLWRNRLPSCALSALERAVLGVERVQDLPSWAIPSVYFDFVHNRRVGQLREVLAHNAVDLLSLLTLLATVARVLEAPQRASQTTDLESVLRLYQGAGLTDEAVDWCEPAAAALPPLARERLRLRLAAMLRRSGNLLAAVRLWEVQARESGPMAVRAHVELAKYHEHQRRDVHAAIRATEAALTTVSIWHHGFDPTPRYDLERRLVRLRNRLRHQRQLVPTRVAAG